MAVFKINESQCNQLRLALKAVSQIVDSSLLQLDDLELDVKFEPLPDIVEIDGVTPYNNYYDRDCCEGMDW